MITRRSIRFLFLLCMVYLSSQPARGQSGAALNEVKQLMERYKYDEACNLAGQYLQTDSTSVPMLLLKGRALAARFKYQEARLVLSGVIRLDPANIQGWFTLGTIYRQLGNNDLAIEASRRAIALDTANRFFSLQLAGLYMADEAFGRAKRVLLPIFRSDTGDLYVVKQLGNCYAELKMADSAIYFYNRALAQIGRAHV